MKNLILKSWNYFKDKFWQFTFRIFPTKFDPAPDISLGKKIFITSECLFELLGEFRNFKLISLIDVWRNQSSKIVFRISIVMRNFDRPSYLTDRRSIKPKI